MEFNKINVITYTVVKQEVSTLNFFSYPLKISNQGCITQLYRTQKKKG